MQNHLQIQSTGVNISTDSVSLFVVSLTQCYTRQQHNLPSLFATPTGAILPQDANVAWSSCLCAMSTCYLVSTWSCTILSLDTFSRFRLKTKDSCLFTSKAILETTADVSDSLRLEAMIFSGLQTGFCHVYLMICLRFSVKNGNIL